MAADPTRRRVLAASALTLLAAGGTAGCGRIFPWSKPPRTASDVGVLADVIAAEKAMITRYRSVIARFPVLGKDLSPLLRQHEAHLTQLRGRLVVPPGAHAPVPGGSAGHGSSSAEPRQGTASPSARTAPVPAPVPVTATAAISYLRAAERDEAAALVRWLPAVPPSLAQLLASIGACEASHAALLHSVRRA